MPKVVFKYSKKQELETILWTVKNYENIKNFCDMIFCPKIPKNLWDSIANDSETFAKTRNLLKKHLETTSQFIVFDETKKQAIALWKKIEKEFFAKVEKLAKTSLADQYICYLTFYGGGGSFNLPNEIWVRINPKEKNYLKYFNYTVAHEIVHLLLDKKHKGKSQDIKEKEVDEILIKTDLFK